MTIISRYNAEWDRVNLSDTNAIKGLLKFRYKFDALLEYRGNNYDIMSSSTDCSDVNEDAICLYADLDNLIDKANFNEYQTKILNMYIYGNTEDDIAEKLGVGKQSVNSVIDNMCGVICRLNYQEWKLNYVFWDKAKVRSDFKKCSKCREFLPATLGYFSPDVRNSDKLHSNCKICRQK